MSVEYRSGVDVKDAVRDFLADPNKMFMCVLVYNIEDETFEAYIHGGILNAEEITDEIIDLITANLVHVSRKREIN